MIQKPKILPGMGLTYNDVLLVPQYSEINSRNEVNVSAQLTKKIRLKIPFVSGNMDTVTESKMAISMARIGGIGIIHRYMKIEDQANEVLKVKRAESVIIERPFIISENQSLHDAKSLMLKQEIHGLLVVDEYEKLVGILSNRDIKFIDDERVAVKEIMTKNPITAPIGTGTEAARGILQKYRIEKLPLVDEEGNIFGLITSKDIENRDKYPLASKDKKGRLLVGAAVGVKRDYLERTEALLNSGCDCILIDVAHGHNKLAINATKQIKKRFETELIVGNVATALATQDLISAGADCVKIGIGSGAICTTRLVAGAGVPQFTAVLDCSRIGHEYNVPVMADGGIGGMAGNIAKAIGAGASTVMRNRSLAGTAESPGITIMRNGRKYKIYRGSASFGANMTRNQKMGEDVDVEYNPEGVEALVHYTGTAEELIKPLVKGLKSGMSYTGAYTIEDFWKKAEFVRISPASWQESKPHDVELI